MLVEETSRLESVVLLAKLAFNQINGLATAIYSRTGLGVWLLNVKKSEAAPIPWAQRPC